MNLRDVVSQLEYEAEVNDAHCRALKMEEYRAKTEESRLRRILAAQQRALAAQQRTQQRAEQQAERRAWQIMERTQQAAAPKPPAVLRPPRPPKPRVIRGWREPVIETGFDWETMARYKLQDQLDLEALRPNCQLSMPVKRVDFSQLPAERQVLGAIGQRKYWLRYSV